MPTMHNNLLAPVVLVTKGRGREVFDDSSALMRRLEEIPTIGDSIMSIQTPIHAVTDEGIAALETMLRVVGFTPFKRAAVRCREETGRPVSRFGTRWNWAFLSDYLGWEWRPLK